MSSSRHSISTSSGETISSMVPPSAAARIAIFFTPGVRSRTAPVRSMRKLSGITRPATTTSPSPQLASMSRSSVLLIGFCVKSTPATAGSRSDWTTTPTLGRVKRPTRWRYVIAESEFADHQISRMAARRSSTEGTLSSVRCWPAKLASAPSSSAADERTASGPASERAAVMSCSRACSSPAATASTKEPESAMPGGIGKPARAAAPSPVAFAPKSESSSASGSATTSVTRNPLLHRHRRPLVYACHRGFGQSRRASRRRREYRTHAPRLLNVRAGRPHR